MNATRLWRRPEGGFGLTTTAVDLTENQVVVATGPYELPTIPRAAERLPASVRSLDSSDHRTPEALPGSHPPALDRDNP